jgi:hypothetical protein
MAARAAALLHEDRADGHCVWDPRRERRRPRDDYPDQSTSFNTHNPHPAMQHPAVGPIALRHGTLW